MSIIDSAKQAAQGLMQGAMEKLVPLAPDSWIPGGRPDPLIAHKHGLIGTPETIRRRLAAYEAAGVQELAISFGGPDPLATLRRYAAEIMRTSTAPSRPPAGTAARS